MAKHHKKTSSKLISSFSNYSRYLDYVLTVSNSNFLTFETNVFQGTYIEKRLTLQVTPVHFWM
jgi:hypothetical protein